MSNTLSIADVSALSTILDAASRSANVRWIDENGNLRSGVARHIVRGATDFNFIGRDTDVRDAFLRITTNGFDVTVAVRFLMELVHEGGFAIDS